MVMIHWFIKMNLQRIKKVRKAFDKRDPDPSKNYGFHGSEIALALEGEEGAVTWILFTSRQLPHVTKEMVQRYRIEMPEDIVGTLLEYSGDFNEGEELKQVIKYGKYLQEQGFNDLTCSCLFRPMGADLGYHSPKPMYDGHEPCRIHLKKMEFKDEIFTPPVYGDPIICEHLKNDMPCYYDGSALAGHEMYHTLLSGGEEAIWKKLEVYYMSTFLESDVNKKA